MAVYLVTQGSGSSLSIGTPTSLNFFKCPRSLLVPHCSLVHSPSRTPSYTRRETRFVLRVRRRLPDKYGTRDGTTESDDSGPSSVPSVSWTTTDGGMDKQHTRMRYRGSTLSCRDKSDPNIVFCPSVRGTTQQTNEDRRQVSAKRVSKEYSWTPNRLIERTLPRIRTPIMRQSFPWSLERSWKVVTDTVGESPPNYAGMTSRSVGTKTPSVWKIELNGKQSLPTSCSFT